MSKAVLSLLVVLGTVNPVYASCPLSLAKSGVNTLVVSPVKKVVSVVKGLVQGTVGLLADSAKALVK